MQWLHLGLPLLESQPAWKTSASCVDDRNRDQVSCWILNMRSLLHAMSLSVLFFQSKLPTGRRVFKAEVVKLNKNIAVKEADIICACVPCNKGIGALMTSPFHINSHIVEHDEYRKSHKPTRKQRQGKKSAIFRKLSIFLSQYLVVCPLAKNISKLFCTGYYGSMSRELLYTPLFVYYGGQMRETSYVTLTVPSSTILATVMLEVS